MLLAFILGIVIIVVFGVMCAYKEVYGEIKTSSKVQMSYVEVKELTIAYRISRHKEISGDCRLLPLLQHGSQIKCINIRYKYCRNDNPAVNLFQRRDEIYANGIILHEDGSNITGIDWQTMIDLGYSIFTFPRITHAITAVCAISNFESQNIAIKHVYTMVEKVITTHRLCGYPQFEIYNKSHIQIIIPLSRQICYFVPEAVPQSPYQWYLNYVTRTDQEQLISNLNHNC